MCRCVCSLFVVCCLSCGGYCVVCVVCCLCSIDVAIVRCLPYVVCRAVSAVGCWLALDVSERRLLSFVVGFHAMCHVLCVV